MPLNIPNNRQDNHQNVDTYNYSKTLYRSDLYNSTSHIFKSTVQSINDQRKDRFMQDTLFAKTDRNMPNNLSQDSKKPYQINSFLEMNKIKKEESCQKLQADNGIEQLNLNWKEKNQNTDEMGYRYSAARTDRNTRTHKMSIFNNITNATNNDFDLKKDRLRQTVANYNCCHFKRLMDATIKENNEIIKDNQQKREIRPKYEMDSLAQSHCSSRVECLKIEKPSVESTRVSQITKSFSTLNYQTKPIGVANNIYGIQAIIFRTPKKQKTCIMTPRGSQQKIILKTKPVMVESTQSSVISCRNNSKKKSFFGRQSQIQNQKQISIDDFQLGQCKGEGRFGKFFPAIHKKTGLLVGIKQIKKQSLRLMMDQFIQQIKISFFLDHPNLVKLYGYFHDSSTIFLIMEYMEEGTLYKTMKLQKQLTEEETTVRLRQICEAVHYMHENDILHRDIKPQNIVLTHGVSKLCDFGWAAYSLDRRNTYCGTLDYVCPEILEGESYDHFVDIWAIGVLAFEMMVGKAPFYHISRQQTIKNIMKCDFSFPQDLPNNAKNFITKALQKNPDKRFSVGSLLEDSFLFEVAKM